MPTLVINGSEIEVDDSFLSLSPEDQEKTVDEIAMSLGSPSAQPSQEAINNRVSQAHEAAATAPMPQTESGVFDALSRGRDSGLMFGWDDEIAAGMLSPIEATKRFIQGQGFNLGDVYSELQKEFDTEKKQRRENHPVASAIGEVAGGLASGGGLAKAGVTLAGKATSTAGRIAGGTGEGIAYGAVIGAGEAEQGERSKGALTGAAIGAITGGLGEGAVTALTRRKVLKETIPQLADLKAASQSLYRDAKNANVALKQPYFANVIGRMKAAAGRVNEKLHPKSTGVLEVLEKEIGRTPSLQEVDEVRRIVAGARKTAEPDDARLLGKMLKTLDRSLDNIPTGASTGNAADGIKYWREAQALWAKQAKTEIIEDIMEKARNQATGFENGMRVQFRQLANNKKRFSQFSEEERSAIKRIVRGGPIENALRAVGWLSPTGVFGALTTGAVGTSTGILPGAAMAGAGYVSRKGAEALTRGNVAALDRTVKIGTPQIALPTSKFAPFIGAGSTATVGNLPLLRK